MARSHKIVLTVFGSVALAAVVVGVSGGSMKAIFISFLTWVHGAGILGAILYSLLYVGACVCFIPPLLLNTAAGFLWGPTVGSAVVLPANVTAAVVTFGLGRRLGRAWLVHQLSRNRRLSAIDRAIRQTGLKFVFLLKLSPLCPFAIMNYALGATQLRLRDFAWASLVGSVPGTLLYVWLGSLLRSISDVLSRQTPNAPQWPHALMVGIITLGAAVLVLIRAARQELERASPRQQTPILRGRHQPFGSGL